MGVGVVAYTRSIRAAASAEWIEGVAMSPRNEADRVAAMRAAEQRDNANRQRAAQEAAKRAQIRKLEIAANELIPKALQALAARGYPGISEIQVYVPRTGIGLVMGKERLVKIGAYKVSEFYRRESSMSPAGSRDVSLLSNGRINIGSGSYSVSEFVQQVLNHEGLGSKGNWNFGEPFSVAGMEALVEGLRKLAST